MTESSEEDHTGYQTNPLDLSLPVQTFRPIPLGQTPQILPVPTPTTFPLHFETTLHRILTDTEREIIHLSELNSHQIRQYKNTV